jgi:hypothetical protein
MRLADRAKQTGMTAEFYRAVHEILERLQNDPLGWGDPVYDLGLPGAVRCHGIRPPLVAHFAVYQNERRVWWLDVKALSRFPLAEEG